MDPFKYIFEKQTLTERIAHWQMALSEYNIVYTSQKAMSALAEQLAHHPLDDYQLGFDCTNNMVKYEACTIKITMAIEHQVKTFRVFGDLALVIYQICGEWETRDAKLIPYHDHVMKMSEYFNKITFHYIP
ncbi:hypothetical protein CR513_33849, partial [Mucuna pruriens]